MSKVSKLVLWDFDSQKTLPVTSDKIVEKKRFHPDGLYSERIFGPVKDYVCSCGTYDTTGGICPVCGVRFTTSDTRSTTFGHIKLPMPVINPLFLWSIGTRAKSKTEIDLLSLINYETFLWFDEENKPRQTSIKDYQRMDMEKKKIEEQNKPTIESLLQFATKENVEETSNTNEVVGKENVSDLEKHSEENTESSEETKTEGEVQSQTIDLEYLSQKQKYVGANAVMKVIEYLEENIKADNKFDVFSYIRKREWNLLTKFKEHIVLEKIPVIPPDLRPMMFTGNNMSIAETLTRLYTTLLTKINIMTKKTKFIKDVNNLTWENYKDLQKQVSGIYDEIMDVFGGKTGIIRSNILGKRIDYSGRAVIAIDPSLKYNECKVPYHMALEVYKYEFARHLAKKENKMLLVILRDIEESLKLRDYRFIDELSEWIKDKPTLLNRQPTLHQYGMLAFNTKISSDSTIKISPTVTASYNADFDGFQRGL